MRFANIDAGHLKLKEPVIDSSNENAIENRNQIELVLQDKSVLPEGYQWEEKGREFSYKGMFYDIISIKKTREGWVIKAASDEEEAAIVANQIQSHPFNKDLKSNASAGSSKIKLNLSFNAYDCQYLFSYNFRTILLEKKGYFFYTSPILNPFSGEIAHPPEAV